MMKKTGILTMIFSIVIIIFCCNVYAQGISAQVTALEHQAKRIQSQIEQAKKQSAASMNQQVQALKNSLNHLTQQRVRLDAQIARLESQIDELQNSSNSVLSRQIQYYNAELAKVKQQMSSLSAKQKARAVQAHPAAQAPAVQRPVPVNKPAPAAQKGINVSTKQCPSCPAARSARKLVPMAKALPRVSGIKPAHAKTNRALKAQVNPKAVPVESLKHRVAVNPALKAATSKPKGFIGAAVANKHPLPVTKKTSNIKSAVKAPTGKK